MLDTVIIGCGIIGAATAFELSRYNLNIAVLEAENDVAAETTKANSGIIHAGYDPEPGTLSAKLNVRGSKLAKQLCQSLDVPYRQTGSLVLAFSNEDVSMLEELLSRGRQNGVTGLKLLNPRQLAEIEPEVSTEVVAALHAPTGAIVSPWEYAIALAEAAVRNGVDIRLNSKVTSIVKLTGGYEITAGGSIYRTKSVINAAGIYADTVHDMVSEPAFKIIPDRGEYYLLDKTEGRRVNNVIFQCPSKAGKGVLVSPTVHGNLIVGPNNGHAGRGEVSNTAEGLSFVSKMARKSVPNLNMRESIRNFAGVRAASDHDDFIIQNAKDCPCFIDLAGIKSPGLSAAPAIAEMAAELLKENGFRLIKKDNFIDTCKRVRFHELSTRERKELVAKDSRYGKIICRCESVTEGEILDAIRSPITPRSIDAIKRRCNAGMGRCQGGFCGPRVLEILARELNCNPLDILQDKSGSWILESETKGGSSNV